MLRTFLQSTDERNKGMINGAGIEKSHSCANQNKTFIESDKVCAGHFCKHNCDQNGSAESHTIENLKRKKVLVPDHDFNITTI